MDVDWGYVYLKQHPCESTYEYCERFKYYLDKYPAPCIHFQVHLMNFLDGMLPDERYILDDMAGRWIMDCTPIEVWHLIEDRAADTRPCTEYSSDPTFKELVHEITTQAVQPEASERIKLLAKIGKRVLEIERKLGEKAEDVHELESAPAPTLVSLDDEKVTVLTEEQTDEEIMDEELDLVPTMCVDDVPTEEWITPQCSDMTIEQNTVITCNPIILPIYNLLLSSHVQIGAIQKALRDNQVWGSLEKVTIHIPMARTHMLMTKSEQFLDRLCVNWKTRKKGENKMQGSLEKVAFHTHMAQARKRTQGLEKLSEGLRRTWKRRKKRKNIFLNNEGSMFFVYMQKSRSTFGWKPGWSSWRSISHKVTRKVRRGVRKFDGVHPWAPNIC